MTHIPSRFTALLGVLALSFGLSSTVLADSADTDEANAAASERVCFWTRNIDDFRAIDNKHVYLEGVGRSEKFLATLFSRCHGIRFSEVIALSSRPTSRVCSNGNEHLHVFDHGSTFPQRCMIADIERVDDIKHARALVDMRKKAKDEEVSLLDVDIAAE